MHTHAHTYTHIHTHIHTHARTRWHVHINGIPNTNIISHYVSGLQEHHFIFNKKEELVSFCVVVDTLYVLTVNCNTCILEGSLKPPERYLKITEKGEQCQSTCLKEPFIVFNPTK